MSAWIGIRPLGLSAGDDFPKVFPHDIKAEVGEDCLLHEYENPPDSWPIPATLYGRPFPLVHILITSAVHPWRIQ